MIPAASVSGVARTGGDLEATLSDGHTLRVQKVLVTAGLANGSGVANAFDAAAAAAEEGMRSTTPMQARKGRASYLGERSIGHQDPGATSAALVLAALGRTVSQEP